MSFVKHRHDQMHRGEVPAAQLAGGSAIVGQVPVHQDDGSVEWGEPGGPPYIGLSVSGAYSLDRANGLMQDLTLTGSTTVTMAGPVSGDVTAIWLWLRPDGNTVTWDPLISWVGGTEPDLSADLVWVLLATDDDGASWLGSGGGSGVTDADYLVGTAHAGLSAEIVVGTTPGGELGGTWASPTVDAVHSGSSHASLVTGATVAAVGYWAPLVDSGSGDLIRDSGTNEVIVAFVPTP